MHRNILLGIILLLHFFPSKCQLPSLNNTSDPEVKALNNYVYFVNECTHGMLIVHRMLESFNLDINKYVDLESFQINFYSNRDLPKDIFDDPENWFYDTSPNEWYEVCLEESKFLSKPLAAKLNADATFLKEKIKAINQVRFDIEALITNKDLTISENLQKVYDELEKAVVLFEDFYKGQLRIEKTLSERQTQKPNYYQRMIPIYDALKSVLLKVRSRNDSGMEILHRILESSAANYKVSTFPQTPATYRDVQFHLSNIKKQLPKAVKSSKDYVNNTAPPKEYEMYGRFYFYYNSEIINKFNRYGSGIVFEMNALLDLAEAPVLRFTELPHYYRVIYPRKIEKLNQITAIADPVETIPLELEGRNLQKKAEGNIKVDDKVIKVKVYDHKVQDGDIVSLNFNGQWVLRRHRLTREPIELQLTLSNDGKNYLVLHAENLGQRPPNTMALSYFSGGKKQLYVMNSDMNNSEVIEIVTDQ